MVRGASTKAAHGIESTLYKYSEYDVLASTRTARVNRMSFREEIVHLKQFRLVMQVMSDE